MGSSLTGVVISLSMARGAPVGSCWQKVIVSCIKNNIMKQPVESETCEPTCRIRKKKASGDIDDY